MEIGTMFGFEAAIAGAIMSHMGMPLRLQKKVLDGNLAQALERRPSRRCPYCGRGKERGEPMSCLTCGGPEA